MTSPTVTILASVHPLVRESVVAQALIERPDLVVLRHELTTIEADGCVHRILDGQLRSDHPLPVSSNCCLSCLLREDTLAVLAGLGDVEVLLVLPPAAEPAHVAAAITDEDGPSLDAIVVAVDGVRVETDLCDGVWLSEADGLGDGDAGDQRTRAEVLARQLEHADVVLHTSAEPASMALLAALAPEAIAFRAHVATSAWLGQRIHDPSRLDASLQSAVPVWRESFSDAGVQAVTWDARRPMHPQRLLDALEDGSFDGVVRARGFVWVATRPGTVLDLELAGASSELGAVDAWLAAVPLWDDVGAARRAAAEQAWDPYYGDRAQHLRLTTIDRDPAEVLAVLETCLLTDHELAEGEQAWTGWADPFTDWMGEEAELLRTAGLEPDPTAHEDDRIDAPRRGTDDDALAEHTGGYPDEEPA